MQTSTSIHTGSRPLRSTRRLNKGAIALGTLLSLLLLGLLLINTTAPGWWVLLGVAGSVAAIIGTKKARDRAIRTAVVPGAVATAYPQPQLHTDPLQDFQQTPERGPVIQVQHLNHYFGKGDLRKQVLCDINFSIHPGEIVIMTGPSGSGKTTLLTLIGALRSAHEGSLSVLGQELQGATAKLRTQVRRNIGFVFQAHNLLPFMTARQNVRLALELNSAPDRKKILYKADQVLEKVGLVNQIGSYPEKLSGGQKQRVAIARALVNEPNLILADEPTASLDSKSGRDVVQLMQALAKEQHCAILLVTHDNRILDIADRIIYIENGTLIKDERQSASTYSPPFDSSSTENQEQTTLPNISGAPAASHGFDLAIPPAPLQNEFKTYTVACVDPNLQSLQDLKTYLADDLFWVIPIQDPISALTTITKYPPDLIFLNIDMPQIDGYRLAELIRKNEQFANTPIILTTENAQKFDSKKAKALKIEHCLTQPFSQVDTISTIFPMLT